MAGVTFRTYDGSAPPAVSSISPSVGTVGAPLTITVAIVRYQLFDIDRLINRTVVYGSLIAFLGALYAMSVFALTTLIPAQGNVAVAASTLTSIAVFFPMVFVEGIAGQLFGDLGLTVVFSLLASLAVALFFIPMISSRQWAQPGGLTGGGDRLGSTGAARAGRAATGGS